MTVTLDPKILAAASSALRSIRDPANKIPVAGMYLVTPVDGAIEVTATDCDLELTLTIDGVADFPPVCLPPYIVEAAAAMPAAGVKLTVDERTAAFSSGRSRFAAPILPGADFPRFRPGLQGGADIAGRSLAGLLSACIRAVSPKGQDDRWWLEGVFVDTLDGRLCAAGTNGYRFQSFSIAAPPGLDLPDGIIIPAKAAGEIIAMAGKAGDNPVRVEVGPGAIAVTTARGRLVSKLVENKYPPYRRVIPAACGNAATFDAAEMVAALDRILKIQDASVAEGAAKKSKSGTAIRIRPDGDSLVVEAAAWGEAVDAVRAEFEGEFPTFGVSGKYLHGTLGSMKDRGTETIRMDVAPGGGAPCRLESPTDEDFVAIVMPMRV
ncbi:MAG: DNA polymerase III subunit beta [Mesorhizobium sp.]